MNTRTCVLAAFLAVVSGTAWADKTAQWSARYGGWSKEPSCDQTEHGKRCWVLTIGKDRWNNDATFLYYACRADGEEWMNFSFWATIVVDDDISALKAQWDSGHEEPLETWTKTGEYRGKPQYWFHISDLQAFLTKADEHERLTVTMPLKDRQGRYEKLKFPMKNAVRSTREALEACGLERSTVAEILNQ